MEASWFTTAIIMILMAIIFITIELYEREKRKPKLSDFDEETVRAWIDARVHELQEEAGLRLSRGEDTREIDRSIMKLEHAAYQLYGSE